MASTNLMQKWFSHTVRPLIISAPMLAVANPRLATEVSKAGGFGFISAATWDFTPGGKLAAALDSDLSAARHLLPSPPAPPAVAAGSSTSPQDLPIGVGFILAHASSASHFATTALPVLARHRPAAVWLFAADPATQAAVVAALLRPPASGEDGDGGEGRGRGWAPRVFVQVGTVAAARAAAADGAHVLVAQGTDAGGHQLAAGCGVVSLVPEVRAMLAAEWPGRDVAVVAAGGIADGAGVAAALALGAEGVVMGTRFLLSDEVDAPDHRRKALAGAKDGGVSTVKADFYDRLQDRGLWSSAYDGRGLINQSWRDYHEGKKSLEECKAEYETSKDDAFVVHWAGTAVGLVNESLPAADIVRQVREAAKERIRSLQHHL